MTAGIPNQIYEQGHCKFKEGKYTENNIQKIIVSALVLAKHVEMRA